ncbi:MAG: hypothetical protein EOO27_12365 [Comamonadaceae bacterium]|nr:MAG: hypothetical protein EOO27_12365 [Comamonadaceae bacterium]
MTLTFDDARAIVAGNPPDRRVGKFMVADYGYDDGRTFRLVCGAREYLVGGDQAFNMFDAPVPLVDKDTGHLEWTTWLPGDPRFDRMKPVGNWPDD